MATHKNLTIWKDGINLVTKIYKITASFPADEKFVLVSQIRRAAISVPSNIAEGAARKNDTEFIQFLYISLGSVMELETQLIISKNLSFIKDEKLLEDINNLGRAINAFIKYLKSLKNRKKS